MANLPRELTLNINDWAQLLKTFVSFIPIVGSSVRAFIDLFLMWKKKNPDGTTVQFDEYVTKNLIEPAQATRQNAEQYLQDNGWTKGPDGEWAPPADLLERVS